MPDPINYLSMIQPVNIAESLGQGLQVGEALHDRFKVRPQLEADQQQYRQLALTAARDKLARGGAISAGRLERHQEPDARRLSGSARGLSGAA
jgi:hypothetical protein